MKGLGANIFGFINNQWKNLNQFTKEGDELWEFTVPVKVEDKLMGRAGYCLVRDGEIIADIATRNELIKIIL